MCQWTVAIAQLAGALPPQLSWPAERTTLVRCPQDLDEGRPGRRTTASLSRAATDEALRQALKNGPRTVTALARTTGWPRANLMSRLIRAADRGVVRRVGPALYAAGIAADCR